MLPAVHRRHHLRQLGERPGERHHLVLQRPPVLHGAQLLQLLEVRLHLVEEELLPLKALTRRRLPTSPRPLAGPQQRHRLRLFHHQPQRVGGAGEELRQAKRLDRRLHLRAVGGEAEDQLGAAVRAVGGDGREVGRMEAAPHQAERRLARPDDRLRLREGEIEEEEEVAAGGERERARRGRGLQRPEVDDLEAGEALLRLAVEDLEVLGRQTAHRPAAFGDVDRHLDDDDRRRLAEASFLGGQAGGEDAGDRGEEGEQDGPALHRPILSLRRTRRSNAWRRWRGR